MNNVFGIAGFSGDSEKYEINKYPSITRTFVGTKAEVNASGSVYFAKGWQVQYTSGNPWTLTATINQPVDTNDTPVTSSAASVNWSLHYVTSEKELLHVGINGLFNGSGGWISNITTKDKNSLEYYIANPPTTQSANTASSVVIPANIDWTTTNSAFYGSSGTSISASQVVWAMTKNGAKTVPIIQQVLRMTQVVPSSWGLGTFNSQLNRVYSKASVQSEIGVPSNWYSIMLQDTDPSSGTVATDAGVNIPLIYGWLKQAPEQTQNGININIQQEWVYGLYYQNIYGTRI